MRTGAPDRRCRGDGGFTLQELLVTIVILGIIAAPLAAVFFAAIHDTGGVSEKVVRTHDAAMSTRLFTRDVQSAEAVYGPGNTTVVGDTRVITPAVRLNAVAFGNATEGWAVGQSGVILHSSDGGSTWDEESSGVTAELFAVDAVRDRTGVITTWVAGAGGTLLRSVEGSPWAPMASGTGADLYAVNFKDVRKGVIAGAGGVVRVTIDTALSWIPQNLSTSANLRGAAFSGTRTIVVGDGGFAAKCSTNCDTSSNIWAPLVTGTTANLRSGGFTADAKNGIAVGDGGVIVSFKGSLVVGSTTLTGAPDLLGAALVSNSVAWASGVDGAMFRCRLNCYTAASASSWLSDSSGTDVDLHGVGALDGQHAWTVGDDGTIGTATTQGWAPENPPMPAPVGTEWRGATAPSNNVMWAVGSGGAIAKYSGGTLTWSSQATVTNDLYGVDSRDTDAAIAVGNDYVRFGNGTTWSPYTSPSSSILSGLNLRSVHYQHNSRVLAVGADGKVVRCTAACNHVATAIWALAAVPPAFATTELRAVSMPNEDDALVVGVGGALLHSHDGGATWTSVDLSAILPPGTDLNGVLYDGGNDAVAVGTGGAIVRCSTSPCSTAANWELEVSPSAADLLSVNIGRSNRQWASGAGGSVISWDTSAAAWALDETGSGQNLFDLIERTCPSGVPSGSICAQVWGAANTALSKLNVAPVWSTQQLDEFTPVNAPVCRNPDTYGSDVFVLAFAGSDETGDRSVTYVVRDSAGEHRLVRQLCTRGSGTDVNAPFDVPIEVVVAHYLAPGDPVADPACLTGKTCTLTIAGLVTPEDSLPFVLRATRRAT